MTFSEALEKAKMGKKITREGWNGKGMFVYMQTGSNITREQARNSHLSEMNEPIKINAHLDMKAADGSIVIGWLASQTDMLADDWLSFA